VSRLSESTLKQLIRGGKTSTVEFKLAAPRAVDLAERLCCMANAKGGIVIIGVEDSTGEIKGVADDRIYCRYSSSHWENGCCSELL